MRRGFSLLEIILSLALTALLLGIVGTAVDGYWQAHRRGHAAVENAQLARALLAQIADDLRATIVPPPDYSDTATETAESLSSALDQLQRASSNANANSNSQGGSGQGTGGGSGAGNSGGGQKGNSGGNTGGNGSPNNNDQPPSGDDGPLPNPPNPPNPSGDGNGNSSSGGSGANGGSAGNGGASNSGSGNSGSGASGSDNSGGGNSAPSATNAAGSEESTTEEATPLIPAPMIIGSKNSLEIDIGRPLRPDEWQSAEGPTAASIGSTTLAYRLAESADVDTTMPAIGANTTLDAQPLLGLVRREGNRIVLAATATTASDRSKIETDELVAPEVADMEFRYFDGAEWASEWDSESSQGAPAAIEIVLSLRVPQSAGVLSAWLGGTGEEVLEQHRLVVALPNRVDPPAEQTTEETTTEKSASESPSGGSQSGGSQSGGSQTGGSQSPSNSTGGNQGSNPPTNQNNNNDGDDDDDNEPTRSGGR